MKLTQKEVQRLVDKHLTLAAASRALGYAPSCLGDYIRRLGMTIQLGRTSWNKNQSALSPWTEKIKHLARLGWNCSRIVAALDLPTQSEQVRRWCRANGVEILAPHGGPSGQWSPNWTGKEKAEYVEVPAPPDYQGRRKSNGWVKEHQLVMEAKLGRLLIGDEVVHHVDGDPTNNDPHNLVLFPNNTEHLAHHRGPKLEAYRERRARLLAQDAEYVASLGW